MFQGIWINKEDGHYSAQLRGIDKEQLPEGDVTVRVAYSTLNYKDALAITGASPVVRQFPMVPGIDFAGVVESSSHPDYKPGDSVVLNGWAWARSTGAGWRSSRASRATGSCPCSRRSRSVRPWA